MDCTEKMHSSEMEFQQYVEALEVERQKIQVFQRELPLCLELVTQTIERCKQQISSGATTTTEYLHGHQSEDCNSEQTSSEAHHVFEEFIPLKRSCSNSDIHNNNNNNNNNNNDEDDEQEQESPAGKSTQKDQMVTDSNKNKKEDWLRSVQLWNNPTPDPPQKQESAKKASVTEVKRNGGAFQPFQREKNMGENSGATSPSSPAAVVEEPANVPAASSTAEGKSEEQKEAGLRKQRRNWSPELHKRFLNALQQLGGSHAATPKQIRELMKVDGLTNDEVKSHLQKYRLHTRRPTQGISNNNNNGNGQTPQVVFVGGIWVQPSEYSDPSAARIYTPVAAPPPHVAVHRPAAHHKKSHPDCSDAGDLQYSNSPATSSSTHTTTTSHAL